MVVEGKGEETPCRGQEGRFSGVRATVCTKQRGTKIREESREWRIESSERGKEDFISDFG